jgi:hypothetical protein
MMTERKSWAEQCKDPRWQKKRLEIMERSVFECDNCGDKETTLNVHHTYYDKGLSAWEYPDESLKCYCEKCHEREHDRDNKLSLAMRKLWTYEKDIIRGFVEGLVLFHIDEEGEREIALENAEKLEGIARAFSVDEDVLYLSATDRDGQKYVSIVTRREILAKEGIHGD